MDDSPSIASLIPDLFKIPRPITDGSSPLIVSANLLHIDVIQMLPILEGLHFKIDSSTKINMYATLGGYSVLNAILKADPKDYMKLLWTPCKDFPVWIGSVKYTDTLHDLLNVLDITKFGDAVVEGSAIIPALVTLQEIIMLYRKDAIKSTLNVTEIGTETVAVSSELSLMDAMRTMLQKKVRRVFITDAKANSAFPFISSRDIIRFLFSPLRLELANEDPERWVDAKLSEIETSEAKIIHDGKVVNQAAKEIGDGVDDCLVCERGKKVVSRWDIVMKPLKANNYSFTDQTLGGTWWIGQKR